MVMVAVNGLTVFHFDFECHLACLINIFHKRTFVKHFLLSWLKALFTHFSPMLLLPIPPLFFYVFRGSGNGVLIQIKLI